MKVASRLLLMAALAACSDGDAQGNLSGTNSSQPRQASTENLRRPEISIEEIRQLQRRVDSAYAAAGRVFVDELIGADTSDNPLVVARADWEARLGHCTDAACRWSILTDELGRFRFAQQSSNNISGIPWRSGIFHIQGSGFGGTLNILPLPNDVIIVRIDTAERPDATWMCDVVASGRLLPNGTAQMRQVGGTGRFVLRSGGAREISIQPMAGAESSAGLCTELGTIWGIYRAEYRRP